MIDLEKLKEVKARTALDIDAFAKSICEVQPMPDNIISDVINVIGDKTLVITPKEPRND